MPPLIVAVAASLLFFFASPAAFVVAQEAPPAELKIAFIGDQKPDAAQLSWRRTVEFLHKHLKK